ncbi:MAG: VCBS repeat-containing protein, partial [candidate division WOR-3 bacterium]|nr:VCBS repeat-containing protein [candidate division WOR-3 bacterium]
DYDIVSGALNGKLFCYINNNGTFIQNTTMFSQINVGGFSIPSFADIDNDGDEDLLVGSEQASNVKFYRNIGNNVFVEDNSVIVNIVFPNYSRPTFSDIDNDGDFDLIIGKSDGQIRYYENKGKSNQPNFVLNDTLFFNVRVKQN